MGSAWGDRNAGANPVAGAGGRTYTSVSGLPSGSGGVYHPPTQSGGAEADEGVDPGRFSMNVLDPGQSVRDANEGAGALFNGLRQALLGPGGDTPEAAAARQTTPLGGAPVLSPVLGGVADLLGGAGEVFGAVTGGIGGALERTGAGSEGEKTLDAQYKDPKLQAWLDTPNNEDPTKTNRQVYEEPADSLLDTGLLSNEYHFKSLAVREFARHEAIANPTFQPGAFTAPGSIADLVTNVVMDGLGTVGTAWQRTLAGVKNRAAEVKFMGDTIEAGGQVVDKGVLGTGLFASDKPLELTAIEQLAYVKMQDGTWTEDQATDFLVTNGFTAHDAGLSIALGLASPDMVLSFGAGAAAKLGVKGLEAVSTVEKATAAAKAAEAALTAAQQGAKLTRAGNITKASKRTIDAAEEALKAAKAEVDALKVYHSSASSIRKANVLANAAEGSEVAQKIVLTFGRTYGGLVGTNLGKAAKVTRYLIDPLHGIDLRMPGSNKAVDLTSDIIPRTIADTGGVHHYKGVLDDLLQLDHSGALADQFAEDFGVASTNFGRGQLLDMFQSTQLNAGLGEELVKKDVDELFDIAYQSTKERDLVRQMREATTRLIIQQTWTPADITTTGDVLARVYPARTAELWEAFLKGASKEQRSFLKFAGYGRLNKELLNWTADAASKGIKVGANQLDPSRVVLLAKGTFTRLAGEDLLSRIGKYKTNRKKLEAIMEAQEKYKSLRYIAMDPANPGRSIDNFVEWLSDSLEKLPMQVTNKELDKMEGIDDIRSVLGDAYSLGFKPNDEFLHGLERANGTGLYHRAGQAWVDHVADGAISYRPARLLDTNVAGLPIPAIPGVRVAAKMVDHMDSAARMFKQQVSGAQVMESARQKFIGQAATGKLAEYGVNETLATHWWEAIQKAVRAKGPTSLSGARGMAPDQLYDILKRNDLIPQPLLNGAYRMQPSDIMRLVLEAYDGDIRTIGLTQKLSSRVKTMLSADGRINYAGQIAEMVWPTLKFRYNPIFQLQEKIEPWVLNAQRGVSFATGADLSKEDQMLEALLQRMTDNSLVRQADLDQFEYSSRILYGKRMGETAADPTSRLSKVTDKVFGDIQGMKRVNMLRTFKKGLGREVKAAWEEANPGAWEQMKLHANVKAGRIISDDDFALSLMAQQRLANDIVVKRLSGVLNKSGLTADWRNAIKTGEWHVPADLGELKPLDLEHMTEALQFVRKGGLHQGDPIENLNDLRAALANKEVTLDDVEEALNVMQADPDYIRRVKNALDFNWNGFWKTAEKRFSLTREESIALQDMMAGAARVRDMTPVDFMSQVFAPGILDGTEGLLGSIDGPLTILRQAKAAGRKVRAKDAKLKETRTQLAGVAEQSTREDLVRQMSRAFSAHLDPSAKRALLAEFRPELRDILRKHGEIDMQSLKGLWDEDMDTALADRILGYMDGVAPTHPFDELTDATRGVAEARDGALKYMRDRGVLPREGRQHFKVDEPFYEDSARAYSALKPIEYEKTGRRPTIQSLRKSDTNLKPRPAEVDERTYQAYQDFVVDTRAQWDFMTKPKSEGGLGLKVIIAKGDPYGGDSAAMVADVRKGQLRVFAGDSDHPLMTNEQNVMFRAVHDYFGHAAEGFEFGPRGELNAAVKHSQMYSDTGRAAMLTETHGQTSWVNYSDDVIEGAPAPLPLDDLDPASDFEARHPFEVPDRQVLTNLGPDDLPPDFAEVTLSETLVHTYSRRLGDGIMSLPPELQKAILQPVEDVLNQFPDLKVFHIDVVDFEGTATTLDDNMLVGLGYKKGESPFALTFGADNGEAVIFFNSKYANPANWQGEWQAKTMQNEWSRTWDEFHRKDLGKSAPRRTQFGVPHNVPDFATQQLTIQSVMRHEVGHAFDVQLRPHQPALGRGGVRLTDRTGKPQWKQVPLPGAEEYHDMMTRFQTGDAALELSEYAHTNSAEFAAELFSLATDPSLDIALLTERLPALGEAVDELRTFLKQTGDWVDPTGNPLAGQTVRQANAAKRGSVYAPQKAGLLPQDILDRFGAQFVGRGKHVETNPDVARTAQMFGKWTDAVVTNGLLKGEKGQFADLLGDIAGIPSTAAVPYNFTEAAAMNLATNAMTRKWDDAFRLQYFSQDRTMLERSINHPMFGLYPASYMWGKIAPELIKFIANEPFGMKTGGLLYGLMDAQAAIALRREYDPEFDYHIEQLGHSQALSFLGFLLPSLPWDVGASAPAWMRNIAQQGLSREQAIANGEEPNELSILDAAKQSGEQAFPYFRNAAWGGNALSELQQGLGLTQPTEDEAAEAQADEDAYVSAMELEGRLGDVMQELRAALSQ